MADAWQPRSDGPYDWRTEGPLAYWYHVESLGYTWDTAPLPAQITLERWLRFDPYAFQIYWPRWYELAESGQWDLLYPAPAPTSPPEEDEVVVGPILGPPLPPVYAPTPPPDSPSNPFIARTMSADNYTSPVDGSNELPAWLRTLNQVAQSAATVAGLWTAKERQTQQAVALEGDSRHPLANNPRARQVGTTWTEQALYWLGLAVTAGLVWFIITKR